MPPGWWQQQLLGATAIAVWLTMLSGLAIVVRRRWPMQPEWSRKLVHIGAGPVVLLAWWLGIDRVIAIAAAGAITLIAAMNHSLRLLPAVEDVGRQSYGTIAYGASITCLLWLFWPWEAAAVAAGVMVMACGDGLAGLLGPAIASPSWTVLGQRKSVVGTGVMAVASLGVLLVLRQLSALHGDHPSLEVIAAIALAAVLLEQCAIAGLDNFTVPMVVGGLWNQFG